MKTIDFVNEQRKHKIIKDSIEKGMCLIIQKKNAFKFNVLPRKVFYIEGNLSLIYDDIISKKLDYLNIEYMETVRDLKTIYQANFSLVEIDNFLENMRFFSNVEQRVVLKINSSGQINFRPKDHFFKNTFITSRPNDYNIWASTVEISKGFFDWLFMIKDDVNILYPISLKVDFCRYCEEKHRSQ